MSISFFENESSLLNFTPNKDLKLQGGRYRCTESGVFEVIEKDNGKKEYRQICTQPIVPIETIINAQTDTYKTKIAFFKEDKWKDIIVSNNIISNKIKIVELAERGIAVTSENAKGLVCYINEIISINKLPVKTSVNHLGWTEGGFIPYKGEIQYDGDMGYKPIFDNVNAHGSYEIWRECCRACRKFSKETHLLMAASFASPLIEKLDSLPFFLHLWGGTGTGKTVSQMVAASIWGNPAEGKLTRTLNSTTNALSSFASFFNNIPCICSELQTIKDKNNNYDKLIMTLTEGQGRARCNVNGVLQPVQTWKCCFITSGEEPITKDTSGGGTKNRVIEIQTTHKIIEDGNYVATTMRENYGFAGKIFIENLPPKEELKKMYNEILQKVLKRFKTTDKLAMSIAVILLGDKLSTALFFQDEELLLDDIEPYLLMEEEVDIAERAYEWLLNDCEVHIKNFTLDSKNEIWGKVDTNEGYYLINKNICVNELAKAGFDFNSVKTEFARRGYLEKNTQGRYYYQTHVDGKSASYIKILFDPAKPEQDEDLQPATDELLDNLF